MHARLSLQEGADKATGSSWGCVCTRASSPRTVDKVVPPLYSYDGGSRAHTPHSKAFTSQGLMTLLAVHRQSGTALGLHGLSSAPGTHRATVSRVQASCGGKALDTNTRSLRWTQLTHQFQTTIYSKGHRLVLLKPEITGEKGGAGQSKRNT